MSTTTVLARKWRPKNFAQLAGQEHVVKALSNALTQNRLHHAYLFTGTRGVGKTTIARIFAKSLNCESGITATPCGICRACTDIDSGRFVDLIELDAASNTQVDSMRELLESALYAPSNARFKVYIIDEVHMLSKSAFNAMLKTLEEPPAHVKFILATTDPQKIPVTVLSRCLQFNLKQLPPLLIARHLQYVLEQERIDFEMGAINLVARAAQGSMRDALSLMDQAIAFSDSHIAENVVRSMLGAIDQSYLFELLEQLLQQNGMGLLAIADNMATRSIAFESALQELATLLHRIALAQTVPQAIADDEPERIRLLDLATAFTPEDVQLYYQIVLHGRAEIELAPDEYAGFTMTLLRMLAFAPKGESREREKSEGKREKGEGMGAPRAVPPIVQRAPIEPPVASVHREPAPVYHEPDIPIAIPAPSAAPKPRLSNDTLPDWGTLLGQLNMQGMALQLAKHCVLDSFSNGQMTLCLAEEFKHLQSNKPAIDRLQTTLSDHLGQVIKVQIVLGKPQVATPAHVENQVKQAMQQQANESIAQDSFVREAQDQLAAKIIPDSIKSIN
ncbi:MAG: DNA polymerase III subunit gamma/tau [Gallionella sp.]|nr:DNA polymerase III subunit gamma/tau [Gallionella sp.]MDD4960267.1 DNA polymerase III subunit gamma/tau [Gallionella sp.]